MTAVGKDPRWKIAGRTTSIVDIKGTPALKISEGPGMGLVWLDGYRFGNGTIEIDLLGRSQPIQGSFLGIAFRVVDAQTHDALYSPLAPTGTGKADIHYETHRESVHPPVP